MIYLAGPYSKLLNGKDVRQQRYEQLTRALAEYVHYGYHVFSPITHSHLVNELLDRDIDCDKTHNYWIEFDKKIMNICDVLIVVKLPGWEESKGVKIEIEYFRSNDKSVYLVEPTDYTLGKSVVMNDL